MLAEGAADWRGSGAEHTGVVWREVCVLTERSVCVRTACGIE